MTLHALIDKRTFVSLLLHKIALVW